ncbi:CCR4-NOT transcription complex subunit 10 [Aphomia sociella]
MTSNKDREEPAVLAQQCFIKKEYSSALQHLNELENIVGNNNKRIQHNKAVVEFMASDMKNVDKFKKAIAQLTSLEFPDIELKDLNSPCLLYNYAVVLYHCRYYYQCTVVLDKVLSSKNIIKDSKLHQRIVLLLLEATLCRRTYNKTLEVAKNHGEILKNNNEFGELFERLVNRAQLLLGQKIKLTLKTDSIENIFVIAQQQYMNGDVKEAANSLGQYKTLKYNYDLKSQGEDIWAAINNNLGVIYLSIKKPFLASKYFQHAVKEHFKAMESEDSERLIACKDRPLYVFNLGLALLAANNSEGAFECLVEVARHYPNNPRIWLHLAECCVKKCCSEEAQQYTVKKLGSGPHTRILLAKESKDKYSTSGESFAIPSLSLEFAALCLRNAVTLLPNPEEGIDDITTHLIQAPPGPPINWKQRCELKNSTLVLQSYVLLHLQDPLSALMSANDLLSEPVASNSHKAWAHIYAAEALINLDRINDAVEHLQPQMIHELVTGMPYQMRDMIAVSVWAKAAVCHILRGDLVTARKILLQINSSRVLPLQMYLEICTGNIENCHTILRKLRFGNSSQ